jgi:hypothetical protein
VDRQDVAAWDARLDVSMGKSLNAAGAFRGAILNRDNIGKSADDLVQLWNAEHPEDPIA